jgi:glycine cleavage system regulatory protein
MKKLFAICLLISSCSSPEVKEVTTNQDKMIDSLIKKSKENLLSMDSTSKATDSTITGKVEGAVNQIKELKQEVKQLKEENNELKIKITDANDAGKPFQLLPVSDGKNNR